MMNKVFAEDEARALFRQVGNALLRSEPPPKDFQYTRLSIKEKDWYHEEVEKLEAEMLQMGLAISEKELSETNRSGSKPNECRYVDEGGT